jgi:hypothetical protein
MAASLVRDDIASISYYNGSTMSRRTMIGLASVAAVISVIIALAAGPLRWTLHRLHGLNPAECVRLTTHAERARCLAPYFHAAARAGQTRAALRTLMDLVRTGALDDCHHLAHDFGHIGFDVSGNLAAAIRAGDADCLNGYYHGVVEAAVQHETSQGTPEISGMCAELRGDGPAYDACVHGLGHGLMHVSGDDVMQSRRTCTTLPDDYARQRCVDGVYMEGSMRYLDLDDAHYRAFAPHACDGLALPPDERDVCNGQIGEIAMFYYRHDLKAALAICRAIGSGPDGAACERGAREELETSKLERRTG